MAGGLVAIIALILASLAQAPLGGVSTAVTGQSLNPSGQRRLFGIYRATAKGGSDPTTALPITNPAKNTPAFSYLTFFRDGRVQKGLAMPGQDEPIVESQMRHDIASGGNWASQWGLYQIDGPSGRIVFADARAAGQQLVYGLRGEVWEVSVFPDKLEVYGNTYVRLYGGNGMHLQGVYKPFGDAKSPGITFTPSGEFIDEGILNNGTATTMVVGGGGVTMGYGFTPPGPGRGSYNIMPYDLHLHYADGKNPDELFFLEPGETKENVLILYIGNVKFQRVP